MFSFSILHFHFSIMHFHSYIVILLFQIFESHFRFWVSPFAYCRLCAAHNHVFQDREMWSQFSLSQCATCVRPATADPPLSEPRPCASHLCWIAFPVIRIPVSFVRRALFPIAFHEFPAGGSSKVNVCASKGSDLLHAAFGSSPLPTPVMSRFMRAKWWTTIREFPSRGEWECQQALYGFARLSFPIHPCLCCASSLSRGLRDTLVLSSILISHLSMYLMRIFLSRRFHDTLILA